jgi:hypothetical protein
MGKFFQKKNQNVVPIAEEMWIIAGKSVSEIARALKLNEQTVYRWAKDGDWEEKKKRHTNVFRATLISLEERLETIGQELKGLPLTDDSFSSKCDAISKLLGQIVKLRNHYDMDMMKMSVIVMEDFAKFVRRQNLPEASVEAIESSMSGYFDEVKKKHA